MRVSSLLRDAMLILLGAAVSAYVSFMTAKAYSPQQYVVLIVGIIATLMGSMAVGASHQFSQTAERLLEKVSEEMHAETEAATERAKTISDALGRPAEFFPKRLMIDDGSYFREIAHYIGQMKQGETVYIVTCHSPRSLPQRGQLVNEARQEYHAALTENIEHRGVTVRRVLCLHPDVDFDPLKSENFARHFTDHCKRLLQIAKTHPAQVSLRRSQYFAGVDALVIPGRIAVITADALNPEGKLRQVLCWLFFSPPNASVITRLEEWCVEIDNSASPISEMPDGIETGLNETPRSTT